MVSWTRGLCQHPAKMPVGIKLARGFESHTHRQDKAQVPEWTNGAVCKTVKRGFESHPEFQF